MYMSHFITTLHDETAVADTKKIILPKEAEIKFRLKCYQRSAGHVPLLPIAAAYRGGAESSDDTTVPSNG